MPSKPFTLFLLFTALVAQVFAQSIMLDFPKLSGETGWLYTFSGNRVDSLDVVLDEKGKATVALPQKEYRGFVYLNILEKGGGEFVMAEKSLLINCAEEQFHTGILQFLQSPENDFLHYIFQQKAYLLERQEWLKGGELFKLEKGERKEEKEKFENLYDRMLDLNEQDFKRLDDTVINSSLYAARFFELINYMQRLYAATQNLDCEQIKILKEEMQYKIDIRALYNSGTLWRDVHEYYPGLFFGSQSDSVQEAYANSILITLQRLEEPVLTAFLSAALTVCERFGYQKAQEVMLTKFIVQYPTLPITDTKVQRMLGAISLNKGNQIPEITGLTNPITQPAIIIFFDSNCDHCRDEIDWMIEHYDEYTKKGYRIISISSETQENNYQFYSASFPWDKADRLCDFKGTSGDNFKNFGIIGTPMIFVVDEKGMILGKYAKLKEIG